MPKQLQSDLERPLLDPTAELSGGKTNSPGQPSSAAAERSSTEDDDTRSSLYDKSDWLPPEEVDISDGYKASMLVMAAVGLLDAIEITLLAPSLYSYLANISQAPIPNAAICGTSTDIPHSATVSHFYGIIMSVFSFASLCSKPLLGYLGDRRPYRETLVWTSLLALGGNLVYFFAGSIASELGYTYAPYVLIVARLLAGVGCANTSLTFAFAARVTPRDKRTAVMTQLSLMKTAGFALGPAFVALTSLMQFQISDFQVTPCNSPGLLVSFFQVIVTIMIIVFLKEPPPYKDDQAATEEDTQHNHQSVSSMLTPPFLLCFWVILAFNSIFGVIEVVLVPVVQTAFGWSPVRVSLVFLVMTAIMIVTTIFVMKFAKSIPDRYFLLIASLLGCGAAVLMWRLWEYTMPLWHFWMGFLLLAVSVPMCFSPNRALFSKLIEGSHHQASFSSALSVFASLGGIIGNLWVGATLGVPSDSGPVAPLCFAGLTGLTGLTLTLVVGGHFLLFPPHKYMPNIK